MTLYSPPRPARAVMTAIPSTKCTGTQTG
jgi:hypothetical protein